MSGVAVAAEPRPFDVAGPLPTGVTVLEASAGTGKTYAIAALATRYVADGTPLERLLLVTFTRMATGELRDRVRERLACTERGLRRALAGAAACDGDEVVRLLADAPRAVVAERARRLARALADFDAATIATTHGFCQEMLAGLGVTGDVEPGTTFVEDLGELVDEVVDDLYVRRFHRHDGAVPFPRAQALEIARAAVDNPTAPLEPPDDGSDAPAAMRRRLADRVRRELEARKRRLGVMTYDDLLTRLDGTLADPASGAAAAQRLRDRYSVVLVDEFQDTDPIQWDILRRAFADGGVTLVLIGDPKQAIYAFRGADVYAYLEAAGAAQARATLDVNWRSDQALVDAYDALFAGARLGHEGIVYRSVRAAEPGRARRLHGAPDPAALRVRLVRREDPEVGTTPGGAARKPQAQALVARDLADDLVALLASGAEIDRPPGEDAGPARRRVAPGDVAVLVRSHRQAALVRDALDVAGVPAVINGAGSVFGTAPARDWLRLLEAIERPSHGPRARSAALTPFLGWSTEAVAAAGEDEWETLHRRLHRWSRVLREHGVAALAESIMRAEGVPGRVLGVVDGERRMTDLRHVAQLLHAAAATEQLGITALTSWLRRRIAVADEETGDEERSRRLESDAAAVQVLTIHRSKGLEFPVVYCPFLWDGYLRSDVRPVAFHDPDRGDRRTVDVGLEGGDYPRHRRLHEAEERGEELRLAYVALTRARHQAVVWWAGSYDSRHSALGRLLFARRADGTIPDTGTATPSDAVAEQRFEALATSAPPGCISVAPASPGLARTWGAGLEPAEDLAVARFERALDAGWRRTSYSDITAAAHDARVASEPEEDVVDDEPAVDTPAIPVAPVAPRDLEEAALRAVPSPLAGMPVGVEIGTLVHRVLEGTDFAAGDLDAELAERLAAAQARRRVDAGDPGAVVAGLRAALETPLGPLAAGARLGDVGRADRLDELAFELPLAGGDEPTGRLAPAAIGAVLRDHLPAGDPLAGYAERLGDPALRHGFRGYLTGSIDLVARLRGDDGEPRFAVVDYKTNWLAPPGEELSAWHHRPAALSAEMQRAHYGLQALLYTVALHRYLRLRLPGYDAGRHLAGVLYLFLRGMSGASTPVVDGGPCGVFAWRPPAALVEDLSDVLDRGGGA